MDESTLDEAIERTHSAWTEFVKGNPEPAKELYSHREDVTLANPFGPPVVGWKAAVETMEGAASSYRDGHVIGFEGLAKHWTPDLAYIVELERYTAKVGDTDDIARVELRVTSIFRPEDSEWKLVHRHADPSVRPPESVVQT